VFCAGQRSNHQTRLDSVLGGMARCLLAAAPFSQQALADLWVGQFKGT
jgi:hypothetical protein